MDLDPGSDLNLQTTQQEDEMTKAQQLRDLHVPGDPLVLPNAWDAASARLVEAAGFPAVATSSNAMADVLGYPDGERAPVQDVLAAVARIVQAVNVPVTVDFERGYGLAPAELVERLAATGAVGMNLEDSDPATGELVNAAEQALFLASVRSAATAAGVDLVINARTDSFVRRAGSPQDQLAASVDRGTRYLEAGADCVYPIGAAGSGAVRALVEGLPGPVNVGYAGNPATLGELAALGVARVSFGPRLQRSLYGQFTTLLSAVTSDDLARSL
jgi:2-methylisocitrate lyase-like PEP mutase family enzyme